MTFYLKYRPQKLEELDSESVRETLKKIVSSGSLPHAFLFEGPKGTGKTSAARIIAKIVNCESTSLKLRGPRKIEPCNKCEQCLSITKGSNLDVVELDAASHRGIDDARALKDAVKLAPATARKKVYIIDEAHMLTTEASNSLLKTLEEPPSHVLFILATTNPEKLIETIRSRATSVSFKKASVPELVRSLGRAVMGEKIKIEKASLEIIAKKSQGSFRDAVKTLEQLVSEKRSLKPENVEEYLLEVKSVDINEFIELLIQKDTKGAIEVVEKASGKGVGMENFVENLLARLRLALLTKVGIGSEDLPQIKKEDLIVLINLFSKAGGELKSAIIEQLPLELAIIEWGGGSPKEEPGAEAESLPAQKMIPIKSGMIKEISEAIWKDILTQVKPVNTSIEALLRAAKPIGFDGTTLTLGVYYRFHKERLEETSHKRILEDVVAAVLGVPVKVICTLASPPQKKVIEEEKNESVLTEGEDKDIIKVAEEIFGN
ncbi:DNA polymerase III subunit gamma/tau [Candidatus Woesebacteria bacterium]|nr:DNA polymerase III subunit gamma/tau [Candidatus Woesebacteria bacterium]